MPRKEPLTDCVIAISGDFGDARPFEKLKQWIELNGGKATRGISAKVTHLVCSRSHWKNQNSVVQAALKLKHIKIVSYDWLEDSLHKRTCRAVYDYLWSKLETDIKIRKQNEKTERERLLDEAPNTSTDSTYHGEGRAFHAGNELAKKDLQSDNYHIYRDDTAFLYNVMLSRPDIERNRNDRHRLTIYESNVHPPFLYACTTTYTTPGQAPRHLTLAERGSEFHVAFTAFRRFYKSKTGVDWDYRFHGRQTQDLRSYERFDVYDVGSLEPIGGVQELTTQEKEQGKKKKYFSYIMPDVKRSEPRGETAMMRQTIEKFGEAPKELWQVGGEASEDEMDAEYENEDSGSGSD